MAIAYQTSKIGFATSASSVTLTNITCSGSDRVAFGAGVAALYSPSTMTYAGGSNFYTNLIDSNAINYTYCGVAYLVAPTTSANQSFVCSFGGTSDENIAIFVQYTGVDQATPAGTAATTFSDATTSTDTTPSHAVTKTAAQRVASVIFYADNGSASTASITADGSQVEREETLDVFDYHSAEWSDLLSDTSTSVNVGYSLGTVFYGTTMMSFPINAAAGGATGKSNPMIGPLGGPLAGPIGR